MELTKVINGSPTMLVFENPNYKSDIEEDYKYFMKRYENTEKLPLLLLMDCVKDGYVFLTMYENNHYPFYGEDKLLNRVRSIITVANNILMGNEYLMNDFNSYDGG